MTQQTLLDSIRSPADLRRLDVHQLPQLAQELRAFMVESVSKTGGHLSSSLGATELAIAIHTAFNTPEDRVIWDVGHQAYAHKILTGRREGMATLRKHHGLSGFPKRTESPYDAFGFCRPIPQTAYHRRIRNRPLYSNNSIRLQYGPESQ